MALWVLLVSSLGIGSCTLDLDPSGRHVCPSDSHPPGFACCPGWKQEGNDCPVALCLGPDACQEGEVCVRPGVCRCRPGFFGANCFTRCPDLYWGPDCKERCLCHPHGKCDPASGACRCHPNRWGPLCQSECRCGPRGHCNPLNGTCRCDPGWWAPDCRKQCLCSPAGSHCDPVTGLCSCLRGWWGKRCSSHCSCHGSPCAQDTGRCECLPGRWGAACQSRCGCQHGTCAAQDGRCTCDPGYQGQSCEAPCSAGTYGPQCRHSCGHCRRRAPCSPVNGSCRACDPGWTGTRCEWRCPTGSYGENCSQPCPSCRRGEACHPASGKCQNCEAGLRGDRCDAPCPSGLFGEGCQFRCPPCFNGTCDPVSGTCLCQPGFWGDSCNQTCAEGLRGSNCSEPSWTSGERCRHLPGSCLGGGQNWTVLLAGVLGPLLLLPLCVCCYCCCCRSAGMDGADRSAASLEGNPVSRVKHHVLRVLANLRSGVSCFSLGAYRFPRVTVAHHDTEIPFNPSFIEAPSAAWPSDSSFSSSFDTDGEEGPASLLPASEAPDAFVPEASAAGSEPFAIPRTSSIAKAKRPSVSFAEGTRFASQSPRGSAETLSGAQKPSGTHVSSLPQPGVSPERDSPATGDPSGSCYENVEALPGSEGSQRPSRCGGGHRKRTPGSQNVARRVKALEAASRAPGKAPGVTTIYVTVGKAGGSGEGPGQSLLRRLGSLQRGRQLFRPEPPAPSLHGLQKPQPRRRLSEKDAGQQLTQGGAALGCQASATEKTGEAPPGGSPAPSGEGGAVELPHGRPEESAGEAAPGEKAQEGREPKYENLLGRPGRPGP